MTALRPLLLLTIVALFHTPTSRACGPFFPNTCLLSDYDWEPREATQAVRFNWELERIFGIPPVAPEVLWGSTHFTRSEAADRSDLTVALAADGIDLEDREALVAAYAVEREKDVFAPTGKLAEVLPAEFRLYAEGAAAWRQERDHGPTPRAITAWRAVLSLPPSERRYRSTWAAYMIGRSLLANDELATASSAFKLCRVLAAAGFSDNLHLADSSLGWLAHIDKRQGRLATAMRHYVTLLASPDASSRLTANTSLAVMATMVETLPADDAAAMAVWGDPRLREVVLSHMARTSLDKARSDTAWAAIQALKLEPPVAAAERVAWELYRGGDIDDAARWLTIADPTSPDARWVQSKLLLRAGKAEAARAQLEAAAADPRLVAACDHAHILADLGTARLQARDLAGSVEAYLRAEDWLDAAYVAERVMTTDELAAFIEKNAANTALWGPQTAVLTYLEDDGHDGHEPLLALRDLLGRRLMRAGDVEAAATYFADEKAAAAKELGQFTRLAAAATRPDRVRAAAHIRAGHILRDQGMELLGTELSPDWSTYDGRYSWGDELPRSKRIVTSDFERARVAASSVTPAMRFHYRYLAADHLWAAAGFLPDDDPMTAVALYDGGMLLQLRDPKAADRFYKALVTRCSHLVVGSEAARKRWFPDTCDASRLPNQ